MEIITFLGHITSAINSLSSTHKIFTSGIIIELKIFLFITTCLLNNLKSFWQIKFLWISDHIIHKLWTEANTVFSLISLVNVINHEIPKFGIQERGFWSILKTTTTQLSTITTIEAIIVKPIPKIKAKQTLNRTKWSTLELPPTKVKILDFQTPGNQNPVAIIVRTKVRFLFKPIHLAKIIRLNISIQSNYERIFKFSNVSVQGHVTKVYFYSNNAESHYQSPSSLPVYSTVTQIQTGNRNQNHTHSVSIPDVGKLSNLPLYNHRNNNKSKSFNS